MSRLYSSGVLGSTRSVSSALNLVRFGGQPAILIYARDIRERLRQERAIRHHAEELERINKAGTTMLLTTHYMEEADRLCSRLAIIDNGRIVVVGRASTRQGYGRFAVIRYRPDGALDRSFGGVRRTT